MRNIILSGIDVNNGGVGRLLKELFKHCANDIEVITLEKRGVNSDNIRTRIKRQLSRVPVIDWLVRRIFYFMKFKRRSGKKIQKIKDSNVMLIHIQTVGLDNIKTLLNNNNKVSVYIMDNSFFCVRSYNYISAENDACSRCIGDHDYLSAFRYSCKPFPVNYSLNKNVKFLKWLHVIAYDITFYVQTDTQERIIKKHYGNEMSVINIGMYTDEFYEDKIHRNASTIEYDFVYHGSLVSAKGVELVLQLARELKSYRFFFPYSFDDVYRCCRLKREDASNITFKDVIWETGLEEVVKNAAIILCPSLWSSPVEGALIKSIMYNGCVAVVNTSFSFIDEIPDDCLIKLEPELDDKGNRLKEYIINESMREKVKNMSQAWVTTYIRKKNASYKLLFDNFSGTN